MDLNPDKLGLTEIIRLQNRLAEALARRFTRDLALCITDIVGSTAYFARFGDHAGRRLQQRHFDLLERALALHGGRVVDTAGDGAFSCFSTVDAGARALIELFRLICEENVSYVRDDELQVRAGLHWGKVLSDGHVVAGEAVNLCARVSSSGDVGEIRLTRDAFRELPNALKTCCSRMAPISLKGIPDTVETLILSWHDRDGFPVAVRIAETGEELWLPRQGTITFGRRRDGGQGAPSSDVALAAIDPTATMAISRLHFELQRRVDGFVLRPLSSAHTEVNGTLVPKGSEARVGPGTVVRMSRVLTLTFVAPAAEERPSLSATSWDAPPRQT